VPAREGIQRLIVFSIDTCLQAYIYLTACAAIACMTHPSPQRRFLGYVVGLAGQPAWLWTSWSAHQWGVVAVAVVWTAFYFRGVWTHYGRL
jgi:hypothetical protein